MTATVNNFSPCSFCAGPLRTDSGPRCELCLSVIHRDCWVSFEGCPTYGCANSPDMRVAQNVEV